jgi:branched-chain amino acid transport system ATP-binding protein
VLALVETREVTKTFGGLCVVDRVNFMAGAGSIVGIIGPNGAGKSTLFDMLARAIPVTSGRVFFLGEDVTALGPHEVALRGLGRTFQTTALFAAMSVLENVEAGYLHRTRSGLADALARTKHLYSAERETRDAAREALAFVDLGPLKDQPISALSHAQRKRLAIALALVARPRLLLLDEPFAGINAEQTRDLARLVERIGGQGIGVCLIEHQMQAVMGLCQRIVVLNGGRKIAEGSPERIRHDPVVVDAYLGRPAGGTAA